MLSYKKFIEEYPKQTVETTVKKILDKIKDNKDNKIFLYINADNALQKAKEADQRLQNNNNLPLDNRPLEGMIIAVKDNISTKGIPTTAASKILENFVPVYSATVIERLEEAGAIIIGKTNMDEFAMGSSNETSFFGGVKHPIDKDYVPGGSSGGSAVAVALDMCHIALGSDTGGSIRQPAAFCGTVGYKPTYGRISRYGLFAFASSLDQIGILASDSMDTAMVLDVISGLDKNDSTSTNMPATNSVHEISLKSFENYKIGILSDDILNDCNKEIQTAYRNKITELEKRGNTIVEISFNNPKSWIPTYFILATAEASSNLSRYDGVRFGYRSDKTDGDYVTNTRTEGFGEEVKRRIMLGTFVLSSGYYDAYYGKAQKSRRLIYDNYKEIFKKCDFILMPTTPTTPFKIGEKSQDPISMYLSDFFTASANLSGVPAISVPVDNAENGMPIGLQIQANHFDDGKLLRFTRRFFDRY